jgi:hypothetical protein
MTLPAVTAAFTLIWALAAVNLLKKHIQIADWSDC